MAGQETVIPLEEIRRYGVGDHDSVVVDVAMVEHHHADMKESHQHISQKHWALPSYIGVENVFMDVHESRNGSVHYRKVVVLFKDAEKSKLRLKLRAELISQS